MNFRSDFLTQRTVLLITLMILNLFMYSHADTAHAQTHDSFPLLASNENGDIDINIDAQMDKFNQEMSNMTDEIEQLVKSLRKMADKDRANDAFLGILLDDHNSIDKGVLLLGVTPEGPAQQAGLKANDIILQIDGKPMRKDSDQSPAKKMFQSLHGVSPGESITLLIERDGEQKTIRLTAGKRGDHLQYGINFLADDLEKRIHNKIIDKIGDDKLENIELYPLNPGLGRYFGTDQGLLVLHAAAGNPLDLEEGDVLIKMGDRMPKSTSQVWRILQSYDSGEALELTVIRQQKERQLRVKKP